MTSCTWISTEPYLIVIGATTNRVLKVIKKIGDLFEFASGGYIASTVRNPNGMAKMGVLKKGDFGAVHVGSNTGWLEWRRTDGGKGPRIWLERSVDMK